MVEPVSRPAEPRRTPSGSPFIFGMKGLKGPPPYSVRDTTATRTDSEKSKLGKKARKHLGADPDDSTDVNLKGFRRLSDDVIPPKVTETHRRSVGYDNRAYQDTPDGEDVML